MNNMSYEIIEAIESYYKNDEDMIVDCMLWLTKNGIRMEFEAIEWLNKHDRCEKCGAKLRCRPYKELHPELDGGCYETLYKWYCPKCGKEI